MNKTWNEPTELDEEYYLSMQETNAKAQCHQCQHSFRCEMQCMNEGDCDGYEERFDR